MTYNFSGIVLRKQDFLEKDLFLTVLSEKGERLEFLVKGAGGRSKRKSHLELMNLIRGTLYQTPRHLYLQSVECQSSFPLLKNKLEEVLKTHVLLEILEKTVRSGNAEPKIYELLYTSLHEANTVKCCPFLIEATLIQVAHHLGFLPSFKHCGACHKTLWEEAVWNIKSGTVYCKACQHTHKLQSEATTYHYSALPLKYRKTFEFFRRASPAEAKKIRLAPEEQRMLQDLIPSLFHWHLDQPLKSLAVLTC